MIMQTRDQKNTPSCLWMQAGVVKKKECHTQFQCPSCRFDKALRKVCLENKNLANKNRAKITPHVRTGSKRENLVFWKEKLSREPLSKRPCIHHMKGHIDFKACPKSYHCIDCEFDQYFQDQFKVHTMIQPVAYSDISGVRLPTGYYLHIGHTWLKIEDKHHVRIGMDDFAARLLGPPDQVRPLLMGKQLQRGKDAFTILRDGNAASFPSPVNGVITDTNKNIGKDTTLMNRSPYTDGWVLSAYCPDLKKDLKHLMFMDSATDFMNREVDQLYTFLEQETGLMAADGGSLGSDLYGNMPTMPWEKLLTLFFHPMP